MKHRLFDTIEEMIAPETLAALSGQPVTEVSSRALTAEYAKSGSRLQVVETKAGQGPRYILKLVSMDWDWIMRTTDDHRCRAVTLWQYGLMDRMPPEIEHATVACALQEDQTPKSWALLMPDVADAMVPYERYRVADNKRFFDAMAAMHATFWEAPGLSDPELGLCTTHHAYTMFSARTGHREAGGDAEVPQRILEGWEMVADEVPADVARILLQLSADPGPLCDALARYPQTLVHGDWRHANQGLLPGTPPRVVVLDWQLATVAPPAVELGRYLGANSALLPVPKEDAIEYYRQRLSQRLGSRFDPNWWQPQLELGLLGGFVQDAWAMVLKATHWRPGAGHRQLWHDDLKWWSQQVRTGLKWL